MKAWVFKDTDRIALSNFRFLILKMIREIAVILFIIILLIFASNYYLVSYGRVSINIISVMILLLKSAP